MEDDQEAPFPNGDFVQEMLYTTMTVLDLTNTFREVTGYKLAYKAQQPSNIPITNKPRGKKSRTILFTIV